MMHGQKNIKLLIPGLQFGFRNNNVLRALTLLPTSKLEHQDFTSGFSRLGTHFVYYSET